jgi:hypothetical protein
VGFTHSGDKVPLATKPTARKENGKNKIRSKIKLIFQSSNFPPDTVLLKEWHTLPSIISHNVFQGDMAQISNFI